MLNPNGKFQALGVGASREQAVRNGVDHAASYFSITVGEVYILEEVGRRVEDFKTEWIGNAEMGYSTTVWDGWHYEVSLICMQKVKGNRREPAAVFTPA